MDTSCKKGNKIETTIKVMIGEVIMGLKAINDNELKSIELELLIKLDEICTKHGLKYYLAYGTLLGAVRHKGFIPWDDDIDIWMPREDYDRFVKLYADKVIDKRYVLKGIDSDDYIYAFSKFIDLRTKIEEKWMLTNILGVYIDVFPLDSIPNKPVKRNLFIKTIMLAHYGSLLSTRENKTRSKAITTFVSKIIYYPVKAIGYKRWLHLVEKMCRRYSMRKTRFVGNISLDTYIYKECYDKQWFEPPVLLKFEGHSFYAPSNYKKILHAIYGDYMKLPPVEQRVKKHENRAFWKTNNA